MRIKRFFTINFKGERRRSPPNWCRGCGGAGDIFKADSLDIVRYDVDGETVEAPRITQFPCPTCSGRGSLDNMMDNYLFNLIDPQVYVGHYIRGCAKLIGSGEFRGGFISGEINTPR